MYDLLFRPHRFFQRQSLEKPDLYFPALIIISVSAIGFAMALEVSGGLSVPEGFEGLRWRVSVLTSATAALANILLWPLSSGIILATGLVLWDRTVNYRQLLAAVGYAHMPILLGALLSLVMVTERPIGIVPQDVTPANVQQYLYMETILGTTRYVSMAAGLWTGTLLTLATKYNLRVDIFRAVATVLLPYICYRSVLFLIDLAR